MREFDRIFTSLSFFVESPDYYEGGIFERQMNNEELNKQALQKMFPSLKELEPFKDRQVFVKDHKHYGPENKTFYLVKEEIIEGAIEIEERKVNNFCLGVWQRKVSNNKGLMRDFFVNYLPKIYSNIVSGKTANKHGFKFWKKLLDYFAENNKKVTVLNGPKDEEPYESSNFEQYWTRVEKEKKSDPTFIDESDRLFKFYLR